MPPPIEISGQRYGRLVVIKRANSTHGKASWLCRCDCGTETVVDQSRLRVADDDPRAIRSCEKCRARTCPICGATYLKPGSAATCGADQCRLEYRRAHNAELAERVEARKPGTKAERQRTYLAKVRQDPIKDSARRERNRAYAVQKRATETTEEREARLARRREYAQATYREDPRIFRDRYDRWFSGLPEERQAEIKAKSAESARSSKRRRALAEFMKDAARLSKISDKENENE